MTRMLVRMVRLGYNTHEDLAVHVSGAAQQTMPMGNMHVGLLSSMAVASSGEISLADPPDR